MIKFKKADGEAGENSPMGASTWARAQIAFADHYDRIEQEMWERPGKEHRLQDRVRTADWLGDAGAHDTTCFNMMTPRQQSRVTEAA